MTNCRVELEVATARAPPTKRIRSSTDLRHRVVGSELLECVCVCVCVCVSVCVCNVFVRRQS